jgi:hypothetical protein
MGHEDLPLAGGHDKEMLHIVHDHWCELEIDDSKGMMWWVLHMVCHLN